MKNIVLIGIMGCGKTTIAKELSKKLKMPVIDIDEYLVSKYQQSINEMFAISEEYFRERETICCQEIAKVQGHIISTGGGIINNNCNIEALKENGIIIYLDRPIENIVSDVEIVTRPLLKDGPQKLYALFQKRHQKYLDACHFHVINNQTLDKVVDEIVNIVSLNQ